jgi:tetratricopeptide (TPR) repeat protein
MASTQTLLALKIDFETWATIRGEIAAYHLNRQELDTALSIYLEIDQLRREAGAGESSDHTLLMLGVTYRKKKDFARAISYLQQLYERAEKRNNPSALATSAHHLGWAYLEQHNLLQARRFCGKALLFYEQIGDTRGISDAYEQLGSIALAERKGQEALLYLQRALAMKQERASQQGAASCFRRIACAHLILRHPGRALQALINSLWLSRRLGMLTWQRLIKIL